MTQLFSSDFLAALSDGELAAHLFDALCGDGEEADVTKVLKAEVERRGLADKQVSEAFFTGQVTP